MGTERVLANIRCQLNRHITVLAAMPNCTKTASDSMSAVTTTSLQKPHGIFTYIRFVQNAYVVAGVEHSPLLLRQCTGLLYQPQKTDYDGRGAVSGIIEWQEKLKYSNKICSSTALSTKIPTWLGQTSNLILPNNTNIKIQVRDVLTFR
jgi:hypothetical protein